MTLFLPQKDQNLLPYEGEVYDYGQIMELAQAQSYYKRLLEEILWVQDEAFIYGKHYRTKRKVAWHGDKAYAYTYSRHTRIAAAWSPLLMELKALTESKCGDTFNACLLNLYPSGAEGMAYHSDDEKDLIAGAAIASLSFGAERRFLFKHKKDQTLVPINLSTGSLIIMKGDTQKFWWHRLPTTQKVVSPRINLTFRSMKA